MSHLIFSLLGQTTATASSIKVCLVHREQLLRVPRRAHQSWCDPFDNPADRTAVDVETPCGVETRGRSRVIRLSVHAPSALVRDSRPYALSHELNSPKIFGRDVDIPFSYAAIS